MSMYLYRPLEDEQDEESFSISAGNWSEALFGAEQMGWTPLGTEKPRGWQSEDGWRGGYETNDDQLVTADDAENFANALECYVLEVQAANVGNFSSLVQFCRNGAFRIL